MPSFTATIPDLEKIGPVVDMSLSVHQDVEDALRQASQPIPTPIQITALVDTGATASVIQEACVNSLGLQPVGVTYVNTPSSHNVKCYTYPVRLHLPNNVSREVIAIAAPLQGQNIQCLIGRDVLSEAILIYLGDANTFTLSF